MSEDSASSGGVRTSAGPAVLNDPLRNRGVAFTLAERVALGLTGRLPSRVLTVEEQARRAWQQLQAQGDDLAKNVYLEQLHDRDEVLYYRVLLDHLAELLPVVYDPTVGDAIKTYSHEYRRPRGIYLSIGRPGDIETAFGTLGLGAGEVDLIVCSDAEEILGIGDWGVGGIAISAGKLAVYTLPPPAEVREAAADSILLAVACLISYWLTTGVLSLAYSVSPADDTTVVVMVAAKLSPHDAWRQPILRLADTAIGVAAGLVAAWLGLRAVHPLVRPSSSQPLGEYAP